MTTLATSTAKLEAALNLIPLDASDRLGQALHAAGCPLDEWLAWCEFRDPDRFPALAAECRTAWAQFPESQAGRNPNAVFDLAEEFGWIPDARAAKTEANRKSAARAAAWDLADELDLPAHLRNDHPERDDLARLCRYGADDLRVVQGERCYIALPSGFWTPIYGSNDNAAGALSLLLDHTQRQAAAAAADSDALGASEFPTILKDSFRHTLHHLRQVMGQLWRVVADPIGHEIPSIALVNFDNRKARPTIPLAAGGAIDLTSGDILTPAQVKPLMLLDHGWSVNYRPELLEPGVTPGGEAGVAHYGPPLLRRMALHLLGGTKCIDSINFPNSNSGKTTLADWFNDAFPNMVDIIDATKAFRSGGDRFSHATRPLTQRIWVFFDECDKPSEPVTVDRLNTMTNTIIDVEQKGKDPVRIPRIGTSIMLGADWLPFDSSAQGADTRWTWAWYADLPAQTERWREGLLNGDGPDYLAAHIVREAIDLHQNGDDTGNHPQVRRALAELMHHNANDLVNTMRDVVARSDRQEDTLLVSDIRRALADAGLEAVDKIHAKHLDAAVRRISPRSMGIKSKGERLRTHLVLSESVSISDESSSGDPDEIGKNIKGVRNASMRPINPTPSQSEAMDRAEMDAWTHSNASVKNSRSSSLFNSSSPSINKDENPPEACVECGSDNNGNPMTDIGICVRCALKE